QTLRHHRRALPDRCAHGLLLTPHKNRHTAAKPAGFLFFYRTKTDRKDQNNQKPCCPTLAFSTRSQYIPDRNFIRVLPSAWPSVIAFKFGQNERRNSP